MFTRSKLSDKRGSATFVNRPGLSHSSHMLVCRFSTKDPERHKGGKQWILNDTTKTAVQPLLVGQPEAGMGDGGSGAGYFLLIRHRGSEDFLTMPVSEWQNFKPVIQRNTNRQAPSSVLHGSSATGLAQHPAPQPSRTSAYLADPAEQYIRQAVQPVKVL